YTDPIKRICSLCKIMHEDRGLFERRRRLADNIESQENESKIKNHFTCRFPDAPAGDPQKSAGGNNQERKFREPPDDELHGQRGANIRSQHYGKRTVKTD